MKPLNHSSAVVQDHMMDGCPLAASQQCLLPEIYQEHCIKGVSRGTQDDESKKNYVLKNTRRHILEIPDHMLKG